MTSPSPHLRLLQPISEARVAPMETDTFSEAGTSRLPRYRSSGSRDIDTRENWGSTLEEDASPEKTSSAGLGHPDFHEPTANMIILVASLLMLAAAAWWGSSQAQPDEPGQRATTPAYGNGLQLIPVSNRAGS